MRTLKLKDDIWLHSVFLSTASCLVKTRGSHVLLHVCALSFLPLHLSLIFFTCQMIDCPLNTRLTVIDSSQIIHGNVSVYSHAELPESKPPRIRGRLTHLWKNAHLWVQKSIAYLGWTWIKFLFLHFPAVYPCLYPLSLNLDNSIYCEMLLGQLSITFVFPWTVGQYLELLFFVFFNLFYGRIVDLQCCVNFCYTANCLSCTIHISIFTIHFFILFSIMVYHRILL